MELKTEKHELLELLSSNKRLLDKIVLDFLPQTSDSAEIQLLYEMMRDYPSRGGKGLRGTMCLLWCQLFDGKREPALITAAALELFQNWILIHDDIEDQSDLRRGLPALHKKFGSALAINAGDALHGKTWELLLKNRENLSADLTLKILLEFSVMLNETTEGQQMELLWTSGNNWEISEKDYLLMVTKKAAWYTCISPCRLGVLLSIENSSRGKKDPHKTQETLERIVSFGTNLGIAFQIVDDILNLTADESKYGKEILGDLFEGKRTLMLIHLLNGMNRTRRQKAIEILSKPRTMKSSDEMRFIFDEMKKSGSIEYAKSVAKRHSALALKQFDELVSNNQPASVHVSNVIRSMMEYMTTRDY